MVELNSRFVKIANATANTYTMTDLAGVAIDTTNFTTYVSGGTAARVYEIATPYVEADLFDLHYVQSADVLTITHTNYPPKELKRLGATNWTLTDVAFALPLSAPTGVAATLVLANGTHPDFNYRYGVTAVKQDGAQESAISSLVTVNGNKGFYTWKITWNAVAGADRYNVYSGTDNGVLGYIGQADSTSFIDTNYAPNLTRVAPTENNPFNAAGSYPSAVSYFEQRRCFGGTINKPQNLWMTRPGTESNLTSSFPTQENDSIAFRIAAREANTVRHIVPLSDLLLLTASAVWKVWSKNTDSITPASVSVRPETYLGASNVQPVVTGNSVLYVQDRGNHMLEIKYTFESSGYAAEDVSLMAPHLFDGYTITDLSYSTSPYTICWDVRSDGALLGMTYVPKQQVIAWHQHSTDGTFESIATVAEGTEDASYFVIKRTINNRQVRYVERLHSRRFATQADAFFVDCGLSYSGSAATVITGLYHLEGKTVNVLADGAVHPQLIVTAGKVTLQQAASKVQIGLPITADAQMLPFAYETEALGQAQYANVARVYLRVSNSSSVFVGPDFNHLKENKQRTTEPYGVPPSLKTQRIRLDIDSSWEDEGQVCIRQTNPLPLMIVSATLEVAVSG